MRQTVAITKYYIISGLLFALTFFIRFQAAVFIAPFLISDWLLSKLLFRRLIFQIGSIFIWILLFSTFDFAFYNTVTLTFWNYIKFNIFRWCLSIWGIEPWYFYFKQYFFSGLR